MMSEEQKLIEAMVEFLKGKGYSVRKVDENLYARIQTTTSGSFNEPPFRVAKRFDLLIPEQHLQTTYTMDIRTRHGYDDYFRKTIGHYLASKVSAKIVGPLAEDFYNHLAFPMIK